MRRRNRIEVFCPTCKKPFMKIPDYTQRFCSWKCRRAGWTARGKDNPNWKEGKVVTWNGYVMRYKPDHPHAGHKIYVKEHRLVMEEHLGRYLEPGEEVHHINHDKIDNRIENLRLFSSKSEHLRHEHKEGHYKIHLMKLHSR